MKKLIFTLLVFTQITGILSAQKTITGKVTEDGAKSLVGAMVNIEGSTKGAMTDLNGEFKITGLAAGTYKLKANFVGYDIAYKQVKLNAADTNVYVEIKLKPQEIEIDEVVVTGSKVAEQIYYSAPTMSRSLSAAPSYEMKASGRGSAKQKQTYGYSNATYDWASPPDVAEPAADTIGNTDYRSVTQNPFSTFSIDVDDGSYTLTRKNINSGYLPPKDNVRVEEFINYFDYNYPLPKSTDEPFSVYTEMSACPWNPANRLLHIGIQGYDVKQENLPASNLVFLIDVSGSMGTYDRLPLVKKAFSYLADQLTAKDKVSIVVYAGSSGLVLAPTSGDQKTKIKDALDKLESGGSTAGGAGIELAYKTAKENFNKEGNNRVILATDGDFNVGISDDAGLIKLIEEKRNDGIFLSVIGCGTGNYQDKRMEQLADHGNGYYGYVDDEAEAKRIFVKQMGATILTIAKDVKLQVEFNPKWVKEYKLIGYENRQLKDTEFSDDKKDAGELGAGSSVTAIYELVLYDQPKENKKVEKKDDKLDYANFGEKDILALNIRYKQPKGNVSKLITQMVQDKTVALEKTSDDFRFSAAVAMTGMLLKQSVNKGNSSFDMAYALASGAQGEDKDGYRKEFADLIKKMKKI